MIGCAVALVLLVDVSGSVSDQNHRLQREGIADALRAPAMARMVEGEGGVAVTLIEWDNRQKTVMPWRLLRNAADLAAAAATIAAEPRAGGFGMTLVGEAIAAGLDALDAAPCIPDRPVLDVSGDGPDTNGNEGVIAARDRAVARGVQINGLPIVTDAEPNLDTWYREYVATPDGFVIVADGFEGVARAMRRKVILEVAQR